MAKSDLPITMNKNYARSGRGRFTTEQVLEIRERVKTEKVYKLADEYGVKREVIRNIRDGTTYKWLTQVETDDEYMTRVEAQMKELDRSDELW